MLITKLEKFAKQKVRVFIEEEYAFWLYYSEISDYDIEENANISKEVIDSIIREVILVRIKKKALSILEKMDRTEHELRFKLKQLEYKESFIEEAIEYVKKYHYINDSLYAENYIRMSRENKSKKIIVNVLYQKGIDKSLIKNIFAQIEEQEESSQDSFELIALRKEMNKKVRNVSELSKAEKQKLCASLCRKGFDYDMIVKELLSIEDNDL